MIVQSRNSFLNNQSSKAQSKKSSDSKSFEDVMAKAHHKKKSTLQRKNVQSSKKKESQTDLAEQEQVRTDKRDSKSYKLDGSRKEAKSKVTTTGANDQKQGHVSSKPGKQGQVKIGQDSENRVEAKKLNFQETKTLSEQSLNINTSKDAFKNLQSKENSASNLVSLNLSGSDKKTLTNNEKIISQFEESLIKDLNTTKKMAHSAQSALKQNTSFAGQLTGAQVKVESPIPMESDSQTGLDISAMTPSIGAQFEQKGEAGSQEKGADLNSLFSQHMDQEINSVEVNAPTFAEEMNPLETQNKSESIENMQSIVKQAKAFVDEGGGTMEIHLQPEGLGKVHLKVAVENGQVNVNMTADNQVAKQALEEGLLDIKTALEGQKLLVETLKVEMSPDYQKDFSDLANHAQEQENRDFAQQFLGQFQQGREQRLGGVFDNLRNFQRGPQEAELNLSARNPYAESGKGRTLNLVA